MRLGMFFAIAATALLGASCSVQDFSTKVMDKPTISVDIDASAYGYGTPTANGLMELENGDVITALRVGNPASNYFATYWSNLFYLTDGTTNFQFQIPASSSAFYNRVTLAYTHNDLFASYLSKPTFGDLVDYQGSLVFGGDTHFVTGVDTNRDVTLYFNRPLTVGGISSSIPVTYFASTLGLRDYNDGYDEGYQKALRESLLLTDIKTFEYSYWVEPGDNSQQVTGTYSGLDASNLLTPYVQSGLLNVRALFAHLSSSDSSRDPYGFKVTFTYNEAKNIDVAPVYFDYRANGDVSSLLSTHFQVGLKVPLQINYWWNFSRWLDHTYSGVTRSYEPSNLTDGTSYNPRYVTYDTIAMASPDNLSAGEMYYFGILDEYARGYVDGASSRDGEVEDLTEQILNLQENLSQYQGKDYQQIYNLGYQAGLDGNAQGAATFNSLFGNILTAPLTILNGLTDISFFGMPILTAILSLLMVAMALFLFKRFK